MSEALYLGADIGGTKTKIALAAIGDGRVRVRKQALYANRDHTAFESVVEHFLAQSGIREFSAACFAVAGPVEAGHARLTNLPWQLDETQLGARLNARVRLINDFEAAGYGIAHLASADLHTLQAGTERDRGERVIVGAGTGLGVAALTWVESRYCVYPSEAGHTDFAPTDAEQDALLSYLRREIGHVSYERVVSGPALPRIIGFLKEQGAAPSAALVEAMQHGNPASAITDFAANGRDSVAARALDLFVSAYGSFAGNMALVTLAHGGVYVAGGIAPKIAAKLADGTFIRAFTAKGRFAALLRQIPVHVVMNDNVGLYGALDQAAVLSGPTA